MVCRFFGRYAEAIGREAVTVRIPDGASVRDVVARLREAVEDASCLPDRPLVAVNRMHVLPKHVVQAGDEVAFLPPLAGG